MSPLETITPAMSPMISFPLDIPTRPPTSIFFPKVLIALVFVVFPKIDNSLCSTFPTIPPT